MKYSAVLVSAVTVYAAVIPNQASQQDVEPSKPALSDLFLSANPADAKKDWQAVVPELEYVGLARRDAHGGEGLRGCQGRECGKRFYKDDHYDRHHDDYHRHHEHEDEGYEEHYWIEAVDRHHHDHHRHHFDHDHFNHYNRFNDTRDHIHHHHKADKRSAPVVILDEGESVKLAHGGGSRPNFKFDKNDNHFRERIHDFKDEHRSHRHHDHHDDVEFYREEIIHDHDRHHHGHHHHHHDDFHFHRPFHHHHHHKEDKKGVVARDAAVVKAGEPADFHQGLTDKHICQYFRGIAFKSHELQRSVEQFQYENVPWLVHNAGPWSHVLNGLRQIEWVLTKLGNDLKHTSGFTKKEERDLVGCYYSFAGIKTPNGDDGEPFKKLLCLLSGRSKLAKQEPYAQKRVYNVVKNLEKAYLSTGEQLARVLQEPKYKANVLWDIESLGGVRNYFTQALYAYDVERRNV